MKVHKHGTSWQIRNQRYCCEDCGCIFEFDQFDCRLKEDNSQVKEVPGTLNTMFYNIFNPATFWFVKCPECGKEIRLEEVKHE